MLETISAYISTVNGIVWGPVMLVLILGAGTYLMLGLRIMPLRKLGYGFQMLWRGRKAQGEGDVSPFNALMTSLAATIGTGNIAGVATAIALGGPGALFWMWCTALVGMATKYAEAVFAVHYRETDEKGDHVGGPMYYIKNGLGPKWRWLATLFAIFGALAGFGIGNTVQSNSVADVLSSTFGFSHGITGLVMAVLVGVVLLGGIRRIASVAGRLVPLMGMFYLVASLVALVSQFDKIPAVLDLVFTHAFSSTAATGGFAGATVWAAIRFGVARGVFSNEAGLGSAPIAHAAAATDQPVQQGLIAMLGTFIDTIIICSLTGLVILSSGVWETGVTGATLSSSAFEAILPGFGGYLVAIGLAVFAFSTILGWSFYSEKCVEYLVGVKAIMPFRALWVVAVFVGAIMELDFVWLVADTLNALMALPNLIALLLLSPVLFRLTRAYFKKQD